MIPRKPNRLHARVGIVDSDIKTVSQLMTGLCKDGYRVKNITQTSDLFACINNNDIDVLILDVEAWGIKGYELIPIIKRMNRLLPIIVTSADDSIEIASKVREQGIFFYTIKPLDIAEIKLALKNALNRAFTHPFPMEYDRHPKPRDNGVGDILDIAKASKMLHLSKQSLSRMARQGQIPGAKVGNKWIFLRDQLQQWLRLTATGNQKNYGTLILEIMDEGVAVIDRQLKILSCNNAYLKSLDIPFEKVIGEQCYRVSRRSIIPCEESICPVRQSFKTKKPVKHLHINYDKEGNERYCDVIALPMEDKDGGVSEVIEIIRDNTEMYNTNKHLNWIMGFFAHECKGTLGPVMMNISALADNELAGSISPVNQKNMLLSSLCSLKLLHDMIRNYIISYKAENGKLQCRARDIDLYIKIIEPVLQEFRPVLQKREMRVKVFRGNDGRICCDSILMKIAFGNLISNAAKYGTHGTAIVAAIQSKNRQLELSVFNEGIGIEPNRLDDVLERFIRFDKLGMSGTGLGLHVVKMIAELHGGSVRAESGYVINKEYVQYNDFFADNRYQSIDKKNLKKFARFVLTIPVGKFSREV